MNHITQEKAIELSKKALGDYSEDQCWSAFTEDLHELCNAAIEWHIAQQAASVDATFKKWNAEHEPENEPAVSLASQAEPVGWMYVEATYPEGDLRGRQWKFHQFSRSKPNRPWMQRDVVALYDHPAQAAPKEPNAKLVEALEIGLECAQEIAFITHETLRGYKPKRHAAVDADVAKIEAALDLYKKDQKTNTSQERVQKSSEIKQVPLTEPEITAIYHSVYFNGATGRAIDFARAIEAAHGIGGKV